MTIHEFDRYINGQLMAEGVTIKKAETLEAATASAVRIASKGPNGEAPVLVLRREREPVEPVAWRVRERPGFAWRYGDTDPDRDPNVRGHERQPLYATPPDALALVAAAYRDAAKVCETRLVGASRENDWAQGWCAGIEGTEDDILDRTPADAQAALAAIERAAYERGVRDTLAAADREAKGAVHIGGQRFRTVKLDDLEPAALALLTQEVR